MIWCVFSVLGECDRIYTLTVTGIGRYDYQDKEVLILGGGDGGILYELLKEKPKFITMAEIDEVDQIVLVKMFLQWFFADKKLTITSTALKLCYVTDEIMTWISCVTFWCNTSDTIVSKPTLLTFM